MPVKPLIKKLGFAVLVLLVLDIVASVIYFTHVNRVIGKSANDTAVVGVVLFSDIKSETTRRINHTIHLYNKGLFTNILCVGGARRSKNQYGSEIMKNKLVASGIPQDLVYTEKRSNNTSLNLYEALKTIKQHGWESATFISSPLHTYRVQRFMPDSKEDISIFFSPYSYTACAPRASLPMLWLQVHREWGAHTLWTISPSVTFYNKILDTFRS